MASFFKKKGAGQITTAGIQMSESEAALAQSDFNVEKITEIQNKFTGGPVLLYPGRIFIREGVLWKVCRKGPKKRQFFLFNDILVYGSVVANRYSNQHILPLTLMSVSAECFYQPRVDADFDEDSEQMELDVTNAFQISHANKSFHVFALSSADKANWLANLQKHINKVAQSVRDNNQLVTKPVWVPDSVSKECMICAVKFTAFLRKHHCRRCGRVICSSCSPHRIAPNSHTHTNQSPAPETKKLERTCKDCFKDLSSAITRSTRLPPTAAAAAEKVSSVLQSASNSCPTGIPEQDHSESSTDTDDSDDSGNEEEEATMEPIPEPTPEEPVPAIIPGTVEPIPAEGPVPSESQPTPPPRKKKLKKKLEQLTEQMLLAQKGNESIDQFEDTNDCAKEEEETLQPEISSIQENRETMTTSEAHIEQAKKSRRRKKHTQRTDDEVAEDTNIEEQSVQDEAGSSDGNKDGVEKRSRKTKFK